MGAGFTRERVVRALPALTFMREPVTRSLLRVGFMKERVSRSLARAGFMRERVMRSFVRYGPGRAAAARQCRQRTNSRTFDVARDGIVRRMSALADSRVSRRACSVAITIPPRPHAMPDPLPRKDSDFRSFSGVFADAAARFAAELNLPQDLIDQLAPLLAAFNAAYRRAYSPAASRADTQGKNAARKALERPIRELAGLARATATDVQRIEMGLKPRHRGKARPLPRPAVPPRMIIRGVAGRTINLPITTETGRA